MPKSTFTFAVAILTIYSLLSTYKSAYNFYAMQNAVLKNWQRTWGTALALLALLAWCMPTLAMGCAMSAMPSAAVVHCNETNSGVLLDATNMAQMPCCHKIPLPQSQSSNTHLAVLCTDGHIQVFSVTFPHPHAPLWALPVVSVDYDVDVNAVFPPENFSPPSAVHTALPLHGRAPPSLI